VTPGTQRLTFVTQVAAVGWAGRDKFEIAAFLLPPTEARESVVPLASTREAIEVVP
jgi:hypothetical protein